jgi:hypothetical protein
MKKEKKNKKQNIAVEEEKIEKQENITPQESSSPAPKKSFSKGSIITKIITGSLVLGTFAMLCYSVFLLIHDSTSSSVSPDSYITLHGKNVSDSKKVFAEFGTAKQNKAADLALVGTKLFLSEHKITPSLLSTSNTSEIVGEGNSNFYLYNVTQDVSKFTSGQTDISNNIFYLELNHLDTGDYLVYSDASNSTNKKDFNPYSLANGETINYTIYTLPNTSTKERKRITIRNNQNSPYLLINVQTAGSTLPESRYDAVIFNTQYEEKENQTFSYTETIAEDTKNSLEALVNENIDMKLYKVKVVSSLKEASKVNATMAFSVGSTSKDITSLFTINSSMSDFTTNILTSTSLVSYDANPEIRELVGYLDNAGQYYHDVTGNDISSTTFSRVGKESFLLTDSSTVTSKINTLLAK